MKFPEKVLQAAREAVATPADAKTHHDRAEAVIRKLPVFKDFEAMCVRSTVESIVNGYRHAANVLARKEGGYYGQPAKVVSGASAAVNKVGASVFTYYVNGTLLAWLKGEDLEAIAEAEEKRASGHTFNARLLRRLVPLVPKKKMVQDAVSKKRLMVIFEEERKK